MFGLQIGPSDSSENRYDKMADKATICRNRNRTFCYLQIVFVLADAPKHIQSTHHWGSFIGVCLFFGATATSRTRGLLIHEVSRSHSDAPQSVGLLWTSDQLVAETSTWQHTTQQTNIHAPGGIRNNISRRATADLRLRPRGYWHRLIH